MAANDKKQKQYHFILVHGACHGAWCWYKVKPKLSSAGHRVTVLDLAGAGRHRKAIEEVKSFQEYTQPLLDLLESLPAGDDEKVILVGHSLGGLNLAVASDKYPQKISLAVYLAAFMPDTIHSPSFILEQFYERNPALNWLDTEFSSFGDSQQNLKSLFFGPKFLSSNLYQLSPIEDLELAKTLLRPSSFFQDNLSKANKFSDKGFGSVKRAYVTCGQDLIIPHFFQKWMIENNPAHAVFEMTDADHMPMFSKPQQLSDGLLNLAHTHV